MYWCSSAESEKLVKSVEDALEKVQRSGANPLKSTETKAKIKEA
jgi:coenzyme F420-reducing hydrogenase delta subunit